MRKKRDAIAGRALVIDRLYVHSVLASEVGAELSGAVAWLPGQGDLLLLFFFPKRPSAKEQAALAHPTASPMS